MQTFQSYSSRETKEFGAALAKKILASRRTGDANKHAIVLALQGDLGAGKTTFTQGFARGLGIKRRMASPTFIIMRRFGLPRSSGNIYHIDAYRFKKTDSLEVLGFKEILADPKNVILIEWPEKIKKILPRHAMWLKFQYGKKENERNIVLRSGK